MTLSVVPDVFVEERDNGSFLVFSPLVKKVSVVNQDVLRLLKYNSDKIDSISQEEREILLNAGLVSEEPVKIPEKEINEFKPTAVTLFPTTRCNLRCIYCYAEAGDQETSDLDFELAKKSIDLVVQNAIETDHGEASVLFHGGGEPTYRWRFFVDCVEYAQDACERNNLDFITSMATNGIYNDRRIDWLLENVSSIVLSFDGPRDIQNKNRPLRNGEGSFDYIYHTVQRFIEADYDFLIRSTITQESVTRLREIFDFFADMGCQDIHLETLFECGRCYTSKARAPTPEEFLSNYFPLFEVAKDRGVTLENSLAIVGPLKDIFCGAAGHNFCVTTEGFVSSCYEVTLQSDPRSDVFLYGEYNPQTEAFEIDEDKRLHLYNRQVNNMPSCVGCYAKYQCGGECLSKAAFDDMYVIDTENNPRCIMQKSLLGKELNMLLEED